MTLSEQIERQYLLDGPFAWCGQWGYYTESDSDDDVVKINHFAIRGDERLELDFTPYQTMRPEIFCWMVSLGFPDRYSLGQATHFPFRNAGPLREQDVERLFLWKHFKQSQEIEQ